MVRLAACQLLFDEWGYASGVLSHFLFHGFVVNVLDAPPVDCPMHGSYYPHYQCIANDEICTTADDIDNKMPRRANPRLLGQPGADQYDRQQPCSGEQ